MFSAKKIKHFKIKGFLKSNAKIMGKIMSVKKKVQTQAKSEQNIQ